MENNKNSSNSLVFGGWPQTKINFYSLQVGIAIAIISEGAEVPSCSSTSACTIKLYEFFLYRKGEKLKRNL